MYLTDAALRTSLREIAKCAAPGSRLLVNYHVPTVDPGSRENRIGAEPPVGHPGDVARIVVAGIS